MSIVRTCRVKLGRASKQEATLLGVLILCRQLYNAALEQRRDAYQRCGLSLSRYDQQRELTELRAADERYGALDAQMTRLTVLHRLDKAFKAFYRRVKSGEKPGYPRFKGRDRFDTLQFTTQGWRIDGRWLLVRVGGTARKPEYARLRMRNRIHRDGEIKGLRLVRQAGRWWAHFLVDVGDAPSVKKATRGVGIDVGLKTFATLSDGHAIDHPRFLRRSEKQLKAAHQQLSRCKRGSKRRGKRKLELQRVHERVKNRRRNFVHQTVAALLALGYDGFAVEKLDVQEMTSSENRPEGMSKKGARGLRRGIMDAGWSMFMAHLESKAEEAGISVVRVDPRGTTQRCSGCGSLVKKTLADRIHDCPACGLVLDRDVNAARNILGRGLSAMVQAGLVHDDPGCGSATGSERLPKGHALVDGAEVSSND